jgi:phytoene desaturase
MYRITESLCGLAERMGVRFHFNSEVERIDLVQNEARGIELASGEEVKADLIVSNMDVFSTYHRLLKDVPKPKRILNQERSCSAIIFYWGIRKEFEELDLHNIFFSDDYRGEFEHIFIEKDLQPDPTVYVNITSKHNPTDAPNGCENWFVLINAPYNDGQNWDNMVEQCKKNIIAKVNRILGVDLDSLIEAEEVLDPREIERRTSSYKGALYGTSSNSMFSAFWRHPNFRRKIGNLYFCGGSVHPGGGIPLCLNSAKIVGHLVSEERGLSYTKSYN